MKTSGCTLLSLMATIKRYFEVHLTFFERHGRRVYIKTMLCTIVVVYSWGSLLCSQKPTWGCKNAPKPQKIKNFLQKNFLRLGKICYLLDIHSKIQLLTECQYDRHLLFFYNNLLVIRKNNKKNAYYSNRQSKYHTV